jgi:uncharacterized protein YwqG
MTREEAVSIVVKSDIAELAECLIDELRPSVSIEATRVPLAELPIGASRIGGVPDLPDGFRWPQWSGSRTEWIGSGMTREAPFKDRDLNFVAQFNLSDLAAFSACKELPSQGTLYFFYDWDVQPWGYDPADHLGARVIHLEGPIGPLIRANDESRTGSFPCKLAFAEDWTIPGGECFGLDEHLGRDDGSALATVEAIEEVRRDLNNVSEGEYFKPIHRLFGWPETIQNDMRLECQLVSNGVYCGGAGVDQRAAALADGAKDWRLLLQIDTDDEGPGWMWGDCGRIYFWMHKDDLREHRFTNARLILQCS